MRSIGVTLLFALLFTALCAYTLYVVPRNIEQNIKQQLEQILQFNELLEILISVDGRDVTLTGDVASQAQLKQSISLASNTPGVRVVMSELHVKQSKDTEPNPSHKKAIVEDLILGPILDNNELEELSTDDSVTNQ